MVKRKSNKVLALILSIVMIFGLIPMAAYAEDTAGNAGGGLNSSEITLNSAQNDEFEAADEVVIDGENEVVETAEIEEIEAVENDTSDENPFEKIDEEVEKEEEVQAEANAVQATYTGNATINIITCDSDGTVLENKSSTNNSSTAEGSPKLNHSFWGTGGYVTVTPGSGITYTDWISVNASPSSGYELDGLYYTYLPFFPASWTDQSNKTDIFFGRGLKTGVVNSGNYDYTANVRITAIFSKVDNQDDGVIQLSTDGGNSWQNYKTLQSAFNALPASGSADQNIIKLSQDIDRQSVSLYTLDKNFTLQSDVAGESRRITNTKGNDSPLFSLNGGNVIFNDIIIDGGQGVRGSAIGITQKSVCYQYQLYYRNNVTNLTLNRCIIENCESAKLMKRSGRVIASGSNSYSAYVRSDGAADGYEAAAVAVDGTLTMNDCIIRNNKRTTSTIYKTWGNDKFYNATTLGILGAVYCGKCLINNCEITGNTAGFGGGLYVSYYDGLEGRSVISNTVISNNKAVGGKQGSGVTKMSDIIDIPGYGGGIAFMNYGALILTNVTIEGNETNGMGGGIYRSASGSVTVNNPSTFKNVYVNNNKASVEGGGIYWDKRLQLMDSVYIKNNESSAGGGMLYNPPSNEDEAYLTVSGDIQIFDNIGDDLYVRDSKIQKFRISGDLSPEALIRLRSGQSAVVNAELGIAEKSTLSGAERIVSSEDGALFGNIREDGTIVWDTTFYKITKGITVNGSLGVASSAAPGGRVYVSATPNKGYAVDTITWRPVGGTATDITTQRNFVMPESDVIVNATFKKVTTIPDELDGKIGNNGGGNVGVDVKEDPENPDNYIIEVESPDACKVGYLADGADAYTKLEGTYNAETGKYEFSISKADMQNGRIDVVKAGDVNFDGKVNATDLTLAKRALKGGAFTLDALQKFAAEVATPADTFDENDVLEIRRVAAKFAKFGW